MAPLTAQLQHHPTHLYTLMEESPPPVPPKDTHLTTTMDAVRPTSAHASASKRKRDTLDITSYDENGEDEYTPKRRRSPLLTLSDIDAEGSDETTAAYQKNIRRKKGSRNLSNLNLRHAAETQKNKTSTVKSRKSKFMEGTLTDNPIQKPPSMFMRFMRTDSGNVNQVDDLMEDYHNGMPEPRDSVDKVIAEEKASLPSRIAQIDADKENNRDSGMFGRWASTFHPVALWNKVFAQTRDEIIREDFEEAERKAKEKADIEAQYAAMKAAGMFKPKPIGNIYSSMSSRTATHAPRDSAIVMDDDFDAGDSQEHIRSTSAMSGVLPGLHDDTTSASDAPETASKPAKTLKSRLHLKRPSLTNIQGSLKRAKSDFNLAQSLSHRESSSSISPVKTDFDSSALKKSQSKYDLKKQHKLSKRVSDLESKLSQARRELDDALVDASPMPKLGSRYERFTPQNTIKRPRFVPGALPSLPSERILMAQQQANKENVMKEADHAEMNDAEDNNGINLEEFLAEAQVKRNNVDDEGEDEDEETIKARAPLNRRQYPTRVSSLFSLSNTNIERKEVDSTKPTQPRQVTPVAVKQAVTSNLTEPTSSQIDDMDPNSIMDFTSNGVADQPTKTPDYAALDAKLKALDANVKKAKKPATKTKKRKSGADEGDKTYKPGKGTEEDTDLEEEQTPKKKRKSTGGVNCTPNTKRSPKGGMDTEKEQTGKKKRKSTGGDEGTPNTERYSNTGTVTSPNGKNAIKTSPPKKVTKKTTVVETTQVEDCSADEGANEADDDVDMLSERSSFESQTRPLEPVYEDVEQEEEMAGDTTTTSILLNDEPSKPTAKATPARHSTLGGRRSRSASPNKRLPAGTEEQMITRAAEAAKNHPARRGRSNSPPPGVSNKKSHATGPVGEDDEPVRVVPGQGGVPAMPKGKKEGKKSAGKAGEFEWPDDVF